MKILKDVLERVTPSSSERKAEAALARKIMRQINETEGKHVEVVWAGSSARDTHLKGARDLDIFIRFPQKLSRKEFEKEGLRIARKVFRGHEYEEAYSEHPYLRGNINGFDVEIVPSYRIWDSSKKLSSVDRSVFHNRYLKKRIEDKHKPQIRLLRQFLKGIGAYGAELKTESVPGYVVELLILKHGAFAKAIKAIANWKQGHVIDIEKQLPAKKAREKFDSPLIIIDPVDKNRNVAAALSERQFNRIVFAANAFLKKPSLKFFFPKKIESYSIEKVRQILEKKELIGIEIAYPEGALSDIVWGQIKRFRQKIERQLNLHDFKVNQAAEWTDEKKSIIFVFELKTLQLQRAKKISGPPVSLKEHSAKFLKKHKRVLSGPRIEKGKWVAEVEREFVSAEKFLRKYIRKIASDERENIRNAIQKHSVILHEKNMLKLYKKNREFAEFFTKYLKGKESFL
ncbi:MAG: CCA tRNA nucleotidyltransferase [Candidatus Diapherotrites archaeon]|nr:CCA tRNA nucleotidyltransferase [Candidatus Diapherotrites archaeon]